MAGIRRDPKTGRFAPRRPVPDVDATSEFDTMGDSIEDIRDVSATDTMPGMSAVRHAPEGDQLAQGGQQAPVGIRRQALHPNDEPYWNGHLRTAARSASEMDPSAWLTGVDDGLSPEARAHVLASRQIRGHDADGATAYGDDHGRTMSPVRSEDIAPGRGRRR